MKNLLKKTIILSSLLLMPLASELNASTFSQRITTKVTAQSVKAAMAAASTRIKQATQASCSKIHPIYVVPCAILGLPIYKTYSIIADHQEQMRNFKEEHRKLEEECRKLEEEHQENMLKIKNKHIEKYGLVLCTDPKLLELFNSIKHDMGITEDIPLFIITNNNANTAGVHNSMGIGLNIESIGKDHSQLICTIAHELGHHLQFNGDPSSYQFKFGMPEPYKKEIIIKLEIGADSNAAGYQDCQHCLRSLKYSCSSFSNIVTNAIDTKGYFSSFDYAPYLDRAIENDWSCPAHEHLRKQSFLIQTGHITGIAPIPFEYKDFLPVRDRSSYPDGCVKTPPTL